MEWFNGLIINSDLTLNFPPIGFSHVFYQEIYISQFQKVSAFPSIQMHSESDGDVHFALQMHGDLTLTLSGFSPQWDFPYILPRKVEKAILKSQHPP